MDTFVGAADHYRDKYKIPDNEYQALKDWLTELIKKDIKYYVNGTHTSFCESFHSLCNKLCPKALIKSFTMYCMRKECAAIQWNLKKLRDLKHELINVPYRIWIAEECVRRMYEADPEEVADLDENPVGDGYDFGTDDSSDSDVSDDSDDE